MARFLFEAYPRGADANNDPASGAKLYVYEAGTTTPVTVYSDKAMTVAHAIPVVADASGAWPEIYAPDGQYKVVITNAYDVTLQTVDNVSQFSFIEGSERNVATLADLVADTEVAIGDYIRTLGYFAPGDGGGNLYQIVAAGTGTADGGSYIDLTGISGQAQGIFATTFDARTFGIPTSGDASARLNAANLFLQTLKTYAQTPVEMRLSGYVEIAEPVYLGGLQRMNFDFSDAHIKVIAGGDLEADGDQCAITLDSKRTISNFAVIDCGRLCGGIHYQDCGGGYVIAPRAERHGWRGHYLTGNNSDLSLINPRGYQWGNDEVNGEDESIYTATGLYLDSTDVQIYGGGCIWSKYPVWIGADGGGDFYGHHPANGNPDVGEEGEVPRDHPFVVVSESSFSPNFHDCYFDNGYIWDKTGRMVIQGGRHLVLSARINMTHPYMRVNMRPDPTVMTGSVSDFDTSIGFMPNGEAWVNDASNLVTDIVQTPGSDYGNGWRTSYDRKRTRFIPAGGNDDDERTFKQGDGTTKIVERYVPGTGESVRFTYTAGRVELRGNIRPSDTDTYQMGTSVYRWSDVFSVDLNASGVVNFSGLPTSASGLATGDLWRDGDVVKVKL